VGGKEEGKKCKRRRGKNVRRVRGMGGEGEVWKSGKSVFDKLQAKTPSWRPKFALTLKAKKEKTAF